MKGKRGLYTYDFKDSSLNNKACCCCLYCATHTSMRRALATQPYMCAADTFIFISVACQLDDMTARGECSTSHGQRSDSTWHLRVLFFSFILHQPGCCCCLVRA